MATHDTYGEDIHNNRDDGMETKRKRERKTRTAPKRNTKTTSMSNKSMNMDKHIKKI